MTVAAVKVSGAVLAVFVALSATFLCLTVGAFGSLPHWTHIGGYLGLVTAALAWYGSFAGVVNVTWGRVLFPVLPARR